MIYPPRCLSCGGLVESDLGLCGSCWRDTPFLAGLCCTTCAVPLPGQSDDAEYCDHCLSSPPPWSGGQAVMLYRGNARRLVLMLKHGDRHDIASAASVWMAQRARPLLRDGMVAVPVPLHLRRHLRRRYNQSALLAQGMAQELGIPCLPDALRRLRHTPSLDGQSRDQRFGTLSGAMDAAPRRRPELEGRPVLLVDDVMTSGATLAAATDACLAGGASEVFVCALARVAKEP